MPSSSSPYKCMSISSTSAMPSSFPGSATAQTRAINRQQLLLWCCCYGLLLLLCAVSVSDAAPLHVPAGVSGEQFERADRDFRPLQFGKRETYRPLQFGKRTMAHGPFGPSVVSPVASGPAMLDNMHNGGLEEFDPTMGQYVLVLARRK